MGQHKSPDAPTSAARPTERAGDFPTDLGDRLRGLTFESAPPAPAPGHAWGRFRVEALLGQGGMGRVFLATDPTLGRKVALKLLTHDEQRVRVMQQVAEAVHEAHRTGLIHRDIKPGNILIERTEAGFHPYIADFGIARAQGREQSSPG